MKPEPSDKLDELGLALLKWISSHRGLSFVHFLQLCPVWVLMSSNSFENWDEYARRQYIAKAPHSNPYGTEEQPRAFRKFDVFTKIRVLHQMTVWTFWNPDRIRERMPEQKDAEQTSWVRGILSPFQDLADSDIACRRAWLGQ